MSDLECEGQIDRDAPESRSPSTQERLHEGTGTFEHLADRLGLTTALKAEQFRLRELEKPRPDYGTFLKDEELIQLFPEAAGTYHVDDVRRALMMIRMILDYGEGAFTRDDGDAVYLLLACILEQSDDCLDGTRSANNPAARDRDECASPFPMPETPERPEDSRAPSDRTLQSPGLDFEDDDDDFNFDDDEEDLCSCPTDIGAKAVGADQTPRTNRRTPGQGCLYCGIVGCRACTHEEMYALDLVAAFCSFAAKEARDLGFAMGLVRSLCDELVLAETEEGWVEWRGDTDRKIATIATCAIRDDTYLLSSLSAYLAEPDDPRISVYHEAERGALEQVRASYPDELRPADVTVFG